MIDSFMGVDAMKRRIKSTVRCPVLMMQPFQGSLRTNSAESAKSLAQGNAM
jgi:hypothetical protein